MAETVKAEDLPQLAGTNLEPSQWIEVTQERVNQFAEATNDFQFIHVDPEKAAVTVEIEGEETPALVAEILSMLVVG